MTSRVLAATAVLALLPAQCDKVLGKKAPPPDPDPAPTPVVVTSATTPPVWHPPEPPPPPPGSGSSKSDPPANPDLAKAKTAADAKDWKKVKAILGPKSKKLSSDEAQLLLQACKELKDKTCVADVKKTHPDLAD
ncbi:MAG: hypothetical protein JST00_23825 [Deltaproteobacteria bacterium]|nr:hypothetical protein [Deltaproteobacteria bacterium]